MWKLLGLTAFFLLVGFETIKAGCSGIGHTIARDSCLIGFTLSSVVIAILFSARDSRRPQIYWCYLPIATYLLCAVILSNTGGLGYLTNSETERNNRNVAWFL